jgi:hypothetical protein
LRTLWRRQQSQWQAAPTRWPSSPGAAGLGVALVARAAAAVRLAHPATPLIVNFMCPPAQALHSVPAFAHLWTDKGVDARGVHADVAAGLLFVQ